MTLDELQEAVEEIAEQQEKNTKDLRDVQTAQERIMKLVKAIDANCAADVERCRAHTDKQVAEINEALELLIEGMEKQ